MKSKKKNQRKILKIKLEISLSTVDTHDPVTRMIEKNGYGNREWWGFASNEILVFVRRS